MTHQESLNKGTTADPEIVWEEFDFFKSECQGRDFVVRDPKTKNLFKGYFSGSRTTIATPTIDGENLRRFGKVKVHQFSRNRVVVLFH